MVGAVVAVLDPDRAGTHEEDVVFGEGIDEPLMLEQADVTDFDGDTNTSELTRHFYHRNALGSVMLLTDMNEDEGVSYRYDPYGAVTITVGGTPQGSDPLGNPWTFTARFQDEETGLMYYRARHYSPATGRFLQRDPVGYTASPGLHEYVRNRPTVLADPLGLEPKGKAKEGARVINPYGKVLKPDQFAKQRRDAFGACGKKGPEECRKCCDEAADALREKVSKSEKAFAWDKLHKFANQAGGSIAEVMEYLSGGGGVEKAVGVGAAAAQDAIAEGRAAGSAFKSAMAGDALWAAVMANAAAMVLDGVATSLANNKRHYDGMREDINQDLEECKRSCTESADDLHNHKKPGCGDERVLGGQGLSRWIRVDTLK
jgi:RHS repeat-associated protein